MKKRSFSQVAGVAAFVSTLIWFFFLFLAGHLAAANRQEFMRLHENPLMAVKGAVTMLCFVATIVALTGLHLRIRDRDTGLSLAALISFVAGVAIDSVYRGIEWLTVHGTWARAYNLTDDEEVRASLLLKIELFEEVGTGVAFTFGSFFVVGALLFGICTWTVNRLLSFAFILTALYITIAYSAALFATPVPGAWWTFYELLQILMYVTLGIWLIRGADDTGQVEKV